LINSRFSDSTCGDVFRLLSTTGLDAVPFVSPQGELIGVIGIECLRVSFSSINFYFINFFISKGLGKEITTVLMKPAIGKSALNVFIFCVFFETFINTVFQWEIDICNGNDTLITILTKMAHHNRHRLWVVEESKLIGIITLTGILHG
jgi:CBS-domain-containing membrane protein